MTWLSLDLGSMVRTITSHPRESSNPARLLVMGCNCCVRDYRLYKAASNGELLLCQRETSNPAGLLVVESHCYVERD